MQFLPPLKNEPAPQLLHFPSPVLALIFRLWDMVPAERLAKVLKTDVKTVCETACEMGLSPTQPNTSDWLEKGYISILKNVWHLLPYAQILELMDWSEERLSYVLKEDDFLNVKFGFFKFNCPPVLYKPLTEAEHAGAQKIKAAMEKYVYPQDKPNAAKPFDFWNTVYPPLLTQNRSDITLSDAWCIADYTENALCAQFAADFKASLKETLGIALSEKAGFEIALYLDKENDDEEYHELYITETRIEVHGATPTGVLRGLLFLLDKAEKSCLRAGTFKRTAVVKTRYIYSFCGLYSDCLDRDISISFPDGLLKNYAKCGVNGVWIQAVFSKLAPYPFDESLSVGWEKRIENLKQLTEKAARYGIKIYLYINEPRGMPQRFFETHPHLMGRTYHDGLACLCTSKAEVRSYLVSAVTSICNNVPLLGGFFNISMSENLTHCYSRAFTETDIPCPVCSTKNAEDVTADVITLLANAVHQANPNMRFFALTWAWERIFSMEQIERLVAKLPKYVILMNVSENFLPFEKGGVCGNVMDYTLSMPGPSPWSKSVWEIGRKHGMELGAKVQLNNSWECSTAPYLPVYETVVEHMNALMRENVQHLMLSWTLGGYPSETIRITSSYFFKDLCNEPEDAYATVLRETYGAWAEPAQKAVHYFCKGFAEFPFSMETLYYGPQNLGAANLLYPQATGLTATMTCYCYDDLKTWCGSYYTPRILQEQFRKTFKLWEKGLDYIRDMPTCAFKDMAYYGYSLFKSSYLQISYILNRNHAEKAQEQREIVKEELELACSVYGILQRCSAIGYEAANHYYVSPAMLREKIISCALLLA